MRLLVFILDLLETLETAMRWIYCYTIFAWKNNRELNNLFNEDGKR